MNPDMLRARQRLQSEEDRQGHDLAAECARARLERQARHRRWRRNLIRLVALLALVGLAIAVGWMLRGSAPLVRGWEW